MKLVLAQLEVQFPGFVLQVDGVLQGRVAALFGPSGAGKSTLLELVAGLRAPDRGGIELDGVPLVDVRRGFAVPSRARIASAAFCAFAASREPMSTLTPARANRTASAFPSFPVPPMMASVGDW